MSLRTLSLVIVLAVGLTVLFWAPLWQGGGLIGGDLYSYFFPQKTVYADQLAEGRLPLWNRLVGFGYPLLAESQTGVLYPPNPLLYRWLPVNTAYNVSQLGHYVLAFVFTWLLMRRLDLSGWGATLAAVVFVYGWFPPRICLEWAIIGGVYLPLSLWCVESYLQSGRAGWLIGLTAVLGVHLLAGHFNLAFITQLTVLGYTLLRVIFVQANEEDGGGRGSRRAELVENPLADAGQRELRPPRASGSHNALLLVTLAVAGGFALAAVQLVPTWELKQLSQRETAGGEFRPGYGHVPPWYLTQIVAPWWWYTADSDPDQALNSIKALSIPAATNKVEAHLYFGMLPLLLAGYRLLLAIWGGRPLDRRQLIWLVMGLVAMIYATGWLLPLARDLPGFSFFIGPGRYGIVTTLAFALMAGAGLDRLLPHRRPTKGRARRGILAVVVLALTLADLYWVSRRVTYAVMVDDPPVAHRQESVVGRLLREYERGGPQLRPVRVWAPGANVLTLTGFAAMPAYLGLGPAVYFDPESTMPTLPADASRAKRLETLDRQRFRLRWAAVTHILRMEPLDQTEWPDARLVWQGFDPLLNPAWGRFHQPLYLYELPQPEPFARLANSQPGDDVRVSALLPRTTTVDATKTVDRAVLTVAQLNYPGWQLTVDGAEQWLLPDTTFLTAELPPGEHRATFHYSPASVWWGALVSATAWAGLIGLTGAGLLRRRRDR